MGILQPTFPELDALGIPTTGRGSAGGSSATAGGVVFIAGSDDHKFRAFDSKTGKILWETTLNSPEFCVPIEWTAPRSMAPAEPVG